MPSNKAAIKALTNSSVLFGNTRSQANQIVGVLIDSGLIEADKMSPPEILAERAKEWLGNHNNAGDAFSKASGWSTDSWRIVINNSYEEHNEFPFNSPEQIKYIFAALVLLAKEASIEL